MEIKILGPGCGRCDSTEKLIKKAIEETGVAADVEKVTDMMQIAAYGVLNVPAVIIDGEVKSAGKVPKKDEIKTWLGR
jgi:small redox-active disulfide protein 2